MILKPVQFIYEFGSNLKNKLYDRHYIQTIKLNCPVISVGNLSVGGTGKTPCVQFLVQQFVQLNKFSKIIIVSRSYKAGLKKPEKVNLNLPNAAAIYGDEPCLLQKLLPNCSVWSGPSKSKTAEAAYKAEKPDLIIVDDGFSHRKLFRNYDLVLIDATAPLNYFQALPVGRLREPFRNLSRANGILITRANLVEQNKIDKIINMVVSESSHLKDSIYLSSSITELTDVSKEKVLNVFCGLGHPKAFKTSLENLGYKINQFTEFPDHYMYKKNDLDTVLDIYNKTENAVLLTTEKDLIKIQNHEILNFVKTAKNRIEILQNKKDQFIEKICTYL